MRTSTFVISSRTDTITALLTIPPPQFKLFMDSIIWAIKHTMRDIAETGLNGKSADDDRCFVALTPGP